MAAAMVHHSDVRRRMTAWLDIALARATVRRSLRVAMVVGSILVAINYGDRIVAGSLGTREFAKIALTYCVPYCVATYAAVSALLGAKRAP
jgi:short subunit fatty acids transporter